MAWVRKSNTEHCAETELSRIELNGLRSIGSGKPVQIKEAQSNPIKADFSRAFLLFIQ